MFFRFGLFLPAFMLFTGLTFGQTVHTVSINPNIPAQFDNLADALAAAAPGDALYLHPADQPYDGADSLVLLKPLTIIGGDFKNNVNEFGGRATLLNKLVISAEASGSWVAGCQISRVSIKASESGEALSNITLSHNNLERIDFSGGASFRSDSLIIRNNIVRVIFFDDWPDLSAEAFIDIENNVIGQISRGAGFGLVIRHNFFQPALFALSALVELRAAVVADNYFWGDSLNFAIGASSCQNTIFDHNYAFRTTDNFGGGLENSFGQQNTRSLGVRGFPSPSNRLINLTNILRSDLSPSEGSPLLNAASDGTDIGISGGRFPYNQRGRVPFPHISNVTISNPVLGEDMLLRFTITGSSPE